MASLFGNACVLVALVAAGAASQPTLAAAAPSAPPALAAAAPGAPPALAAALGAVQFFSSGTVHASDLHRYVGIPCMYLEADNVTCAQCSWGIGGSCPYLWRVNSTNTSCTPEPPRSGYDLPGADYAQVGAQPRLLCALLRDLLDAPTALAACCGFDLCHKYIWYLVFGIL